MRKFYEEVNVLRDQLGDEAVEYLDKQLARIAAADEARQAKKDNDAELREAIILQLADGPAFSRDMAPTYGLTSQKVASLLKGDSRVTQNGNKQWMLRQA